MKKIQLLNPSLFVFSSLRKIFAGIEATVSITRPSPDAVSLSANMALVPTVVAASNTRASDSMAVDHAPVEAAALRVLAARIQELAPTEVAGWLPGQSFDFAAAGGTEAVGQGSYLLTG